jgi:UDP-N-acetylglucosamine 4,6-dehydratase/UDP-glucose 4-epimerase
MIKIKEGKNYLVTGGSGFLGEELIRRITSMSGRVTIIARNEGELIKAKQKFPNIKYYTGDIADKFSLRRFKDIEGIFHLAAFKHVGLAESQARECALSNVVGSLNVLEHAVDVGVEFVVGISTDKAAQVKGVYGASKLIMERLFAQFEKDYPEIQFRTVRYGNVLYSTGSVLCKWKELLKQGKPVMVSEPKATRFFWTLDQAVDLIFDCMEKAENSSPHLPSMKSMSLGNLLEAMASKYLPEGKKLEIVQVGLSKGENFHERILEDGPSSDEAEQFTIEEIKELI